MINVNCCYFGSLFFINQMTSKVLSVYEMTNHAVVVIKVSPKFKPLSPSWAFDSNPVESLGRKENAIYG